MKKNGQTDINDYKNYDHLLRFISYYYQIDIITSLNPSNILEIGIGRKTVSNYLVQNNFDVTTCDCDKKLHPDVTGDIRELPFDENSFDLVTACEILEHIPWNDFNKGISELCRVTKKFAIISLPVSSLYFEMILKFPFIKHLSSKPYFDFFIKFPINSFKTQSKEHFWEIGCDGISIKKIRKLCLNKFKIRNEIRPVLNPRHYFFVLEKE